MSVIQQIQEKYAKLMAIIIALALIIFVVMLAFENGGSLFRGGNVNSVGKVNGESINAQDFGKKMDQQEKYLESQGYGSGALVRQQALEGVWGQEVNRVLITSQLDKLGMRIGKKEIGDILYGENPPQDLKQNFTDPNTGVFDAQQAKTAVDQMLKRGTADQKAQFNSYLNQLELARLSEKYTSLLTNSTNFPKWFVEKQNEDRSQMAKVSVVRDFYTSIPDSTVKVTDQEIKDYIDKHKDDFKQEESRGIAYVAFSALPTGTDSATALSDITALKAEMDSTSDIRGFISRYGSVIPFSEVYLPKSKLQTANQQMSLPFKDTILSLPKNTVYGPYLDGPNYVYAKMIDSKVFPDSVKCRHILLGTVDPQSQQPLLSDSVAKREADSIALAIRNGANFDTLEAKYSSDKSAHLTKGVMTFASTDIQGPNFAKEFGQFILFDGKPGDKKVIKTSFGWHYIEILDFIKPEPHYQIAYMAKAIEASPETDANANNEATQFSGNSRNQKSFDANTEKLKAKGINKLLASDIKPTDFQVPGLGFSRAFIKNIYEAKLGDVLQAERVGDNYVVAMVTEINEKGTQSVAKARMIVEPPLRNHKKAEMIEKKLGNVTTLEAAAAALGGKPIETADSLRISGSTSPVIGREARVIGAAFNPANKGKVLVLEGNSGVFVMRVDNLATTPVEDANVAEQRKALYQANKMRGAYPLQALMDAADIKDNRSKIY